MANTLDNIYSCANCSAQYLKWQGRCNECGAWSTLKLESVEKKSASQTKAAPSEIFKLDAIGHTLENRLKTNINELDQVLGGGIVSGSLILLGGDPGVGKSTLALQICQKIANSLYASGEESLSQIKIRGERIGLKKENIGFLPQTNLEKIIATIEAEKPPLAIIDSIQTVQSSEIENSAGSVSQITFCANKLLTCAKKNNIAIIIVGHVTKEGYVAGPKTLEHLVDVVAYLENDANNIYKILRSAKNRFGSTGEIGIFEMSNLGLKEIPNPSAIFIDNQNTEQASGQIISVVMEGSRPFLAEVQALVSKTVFGYPQRRATGFDLNRLQMIIAVIGKVAKINLANQDIYLNIAGGLKIKETAIDLAVCLAIVSAFYDLPINKLTIAFGEIGLSGEIRKVAQTEKRIKEALKLGFDKIILPAEKNLKNNIINVKNIQEAIKLISQKN